MSTEVAFIDKSEKRLDSRFFPSKIGGPPAWLDLKSIPSTAEMVCNLCGLPRLLLCQLYSPVEEKDNAFHRTIFVFVCLTEKCFQANSNRNFIVFRSQLPAVNPFYPASAHGIELRNDIKCGKFGTEICGICGIRAELRCEQCDECICTEHHRKLHTKHCNVKKFTPAARVLLPEFGLNYEPEDLSDTCSENSDSESEDICQDPNEVAQICRKLTQFTSPQDDATLEEIFQVCSETSHDATFLRFKTRISHHPNQVLRYSRSNPLWLTDEHQASADSIPACEFCGGSREFEFEILPQILNHLNLDYAGNLTTGILDWGVLAVYTCKNSCDNGPPYKKEFLWKQDLV